MTVDYTRNSIADKASTLLHRYIGSIAFPEFSTGDRKYVTGVYGGKEYQVKQCGDYYHLLICNSDGSYTEQYFFADDLSPAQAFTAYISEKDMQTYCDFEEADSIVLMQKAYEAMREFLSHFRKHIDSGLYHQ